MTKSLTADATQPIPPRSEGSGSPPSNAWSSHLVALLVTLHLIAITLMAFPAPGEGMARNAWKDPTAQAEFAVWTERLAWLGIHMSQEEFEEQLWTMALEYTIIRQHLLDPFQRYYQVCGTTQSWRMFAGPHRFPARLEIDVLEKDTWRPVYVQADRRYRWLSGDLEHYRFRPALYRFGWAQGYNDYDRFALWVARQAARDFPEAERVRLRFVKYQTLSPDEVRKGLKPQGEFVPSLEREAVLP